MDLGGYILEGDPLITGEAPTISEFMDLDNEVSQLQTNSHPPLSINAGESNVIVDELNQKIKTNENILKSKSVYANTNFTAPAPIYSVGLVSDQLEEGWNYLASQKLENNIQSGYPLVINPLGANVGINKLDPQYQVDVTGDVNISGSFRKSGIILDVNNTQTTMNVGSSNTLQTYNEALGTSITAINIGTSGNVSKTINIGASSDTVNIQGTTLYQNVTNLDVKDKLININEGGSAGSGSDAGFEIEENGTTAGYIKTSGDRRHFHMKVPDRAGKIIFSPHNNNDFTISEGSHPPITLGVGETNLVLNEANQVISTNTNELKSKSITAEGTGIGSSTSKVVIDSSPLLGKSSLQSTSFNGVSTSNYPLVLNPSGGNVGIGKDPSYAMDVQGDVNVSGSYRINGNPLVNNVVATYVAVAPSSTTFSPGSVQTVVFSNINTSLTTGNIGLTRNQGVFTNTSGSDKLYSVSFTIDVTGGDKDTWIEINNDRRVARANGTNNLFSGSGTFLLKPNDNFAVRIYSQFNTLSLYIV